MLTLLSFFLGRNRVVRSHRKCCKPKSGIMTFILQEWRKRKSVVDKHMDIPCSVNWVIIARFSSKPSCEMRFIRRNPKTSLAGSSSSLTAPKQNFVTLLCITDGQCCHPKTARPLCYEFEEYSKFKYLHILKTEHLPTVL